METQTKNCLDCKKDFVIGIEDFYFYKKIDVPPPTLCVDCRQHRRYSWRNERTLYRRNCDLCQKSMVTIYSPNKPHKVYCHDCWWGDSWDPASYGRDFDFSRPFFEQFHELQLEVPRMALLNKNSVNSEYSNHSGDNKNVYLSFACFEDENIMYSTWVMKGRECTDCSFIYDKGERLYETIDSRSSYQCQHGFFLKDCSDCLYCYDCRGCNHCFMSSNLRNKSYVFRNVQLTREEYMAKIQDLDFSSFAVREALNKEYKELLEIGSIHRYVFNERNVNSSGSLLFDTKNINKSVEVNDSEDGRYLYGALGLKDSMDLYHVGWGTSLAYECQGCTRIYSCKFCHLCYDNSHISYCDTCQNSSYLFGCISVKKGEYMIFNKKYSKEEYLVLRDKIIEHMKSTGEYGEFFSPAIAPVYYNETQANLYVPMSKNEVLARGWQWEDNIPGTTGKETIALADIGDKIEDVPETILNEILACMDCNKNFNINKNELSFYRRDKIPLPRRCPNCRYKRRFDLRPPRKLFDGSCKCDKATHGHEGTCPNTFETTYSPDRIEKVYCEKCYQQEVY